MTLVGFSCAALGGCADDPAVRPLAKVASWRAGLVEEFRGSPPFATLEIAYDARTAADAWQEVVHEGDAAEADDPWMEGLHADLSSVDFETEAVAIWSAGESGTCPGWLQDVKLSQDRFVDITAGTQGDACTADYNSYTMIAAIDRQSLPAAALPIRNVRLNGEKRSGLVRQYPR